MKKYIMALDQGTTSCRSILFDHDGQVVSVAQKEFQQIYPHPGWVEHDPMEIWNTQLFAALESLRKVGATAQEIAAIGITNQRETTVVWDKTTGQPVANAIVWQCRRTAERIDELKDEVLKDEQSKIKDEQLKIMQDSIAGDQQLAAEIEYLKSDIDGLHTKLDEIAGTLQKLCDKEEAEGMSRAQNRLLEMYKRYGLNNETKTWSRYESEVFFNTLDSYVAHGGNSFILETVVPVMKLLTVIDE